MYRYSVLRYITILPAFWLLFSGCATKEKVSPISSEALKKLHPLPIYTPISAPVYTVSFPYRPVRDIEARIVIPETFSASETAHVSSKHKGLFDRSSRLVVELPVFGKEAGFAFPLPGAKVISPYGTRRGRMHTGIDLKTCPNDTIVAAFAGVVRMSKRYGAYGNVIVIRHQSGFETVYSHNVKNLVKVGEHVSAGDPIALTGRTGRATTEHLHFEVRVNGQYFDPNWVIDFQNRTLKDNKLLFVKTGNSVKITVS